MCERARKESVVLATQNKGKLAELSQLLGDYFDLELRPENIGDVVEDGDTFNANALIKARYVANATGRTSLADDSGLVVDALDGAPGIYSARYAGVGSTDEQNTAKLLEELNEVEPHLRSARFVCSFALVYSDGNEIVVSATCEGDIASSVSGSAGFGYDPVFVPRDGDGRTFSEMSAHEKAAVSHRAAACRKLIDVLGNGKELGRI